MRLLSAAGREGEADQQRTLAIRRLGEAGIPASAALRDSPDPIEPGAKPHP